MNYYSLIPDYSAISSLRELFTCQVVELDPVVADVARKCFGFKEDERLKVKLIFHK